MVGVNNFWITKTNDLAFFSAASLAGGYSVGAVNAGFSAGMLYARDSEHTRLAAVQRAVTEWGVAPGDVDSIVSICMR